AQSVGTGAGLGLDGFGIDENVGAMFRPFDAMWMGLSARNLQESGVGQDPEGYRTRRGYSLALGTGRAGIHLAGLAFHRPDAYYELRSDGLPSEGRVSHAFSTASSFTPGGKIGIRGTFLLPRGGVPGFALGSFLNLPMGRGALVCGYTFHTGGFEETGEGVASHSISINFRLGSKLDPLPPEVEVRVDKVVITESNRAISDWVHFRLSASDKTYIPGHLDGEGSALAEGRIREWTLVIHAVGVNGVAGDEVKTFHGKDLPPRVIRWEPVDAKNGPLPAGFYAYRLDAVDLAGNKGITVWQLLEIGTTTGHSGK
ncbi:MAG: hypothetical protein M3Y08_10290, partial [Fibrobacterota bacterium]|nr:hypothetical protein [Fibrobacterota bacterium]